MTKIINIRGIEIVFNYHYRYGKNRYKTKWGIFRKWELGIWTKRDKVVGKKNFNKPREWSNNLVPKYEIGFKLLLICFWISFSKGSMSLGR